MAQGQGSDVTVSETVGAQLARGFRWSREGLAELLRDAPLWIGMAILYLLPATILARVPFAGPLLVLLLSPMLLAGVVLSARDPKFTTLGVGGTTVDRWIIRPGRVLFSAFVDEKRIYPSVLLGIVTLGLVVLMFITEYLFGLGSLRSLLTASARHAAPLWSIALGLIGAAILHVLLVMGLLYTVHRTMLGGRDPMTGIGESFAACTRQPFAFLAFVGPFALLCTFIVVAFGFSGILGYLLLFSVGLIALPTFVAATICSYREIFPSPSGP
jgi:hypothetical protein